MKFQRSWLLLLPILFLHGGLLYLAIINESFWIDDGIQYLTIAKNWIEVGIYSQSYNAPFVLDVERTPAYPIFLIINNLNPIYVLITQHILLLFSGYIIYLIIKELENKIVAKWGAVFFLLQPYPVLFASILLSETLFIITFLLAIHCLLIYYKTDKLFLFILGIILLVIATYIKPVGLIIVILIPILLIVTKLQTHNNLWKPLLVAIILPILLISPWVIRNKEICGQYTFSTLGSNSMFYGRLGGMITDKNQQSWNYQNVFTNADSIANQSIGISTIHSYYDPQLKSWETSTLNSSSQSITWKYIWANPLDFIYFSLKAIWKQLSGVGYSTALKISHSEIIAALCATLEAICLVIMYLGLLLYLYTIKKINPFYLVLFIIILLFTALHTTAYAEGRFRLICDPLLVLILASVSKPYLERFSEH